MNTEGLTLWMHLNKEDAGLPLIKTLEAQTELAPAQYQFKHLSFQEGLFAQHLLIQADLGWEGWETDAISCEFLNNPFMNNTCRIAAGFLGSRLAKRRPAWNFSTSDARLTEVMATVMTTDCVGLPSSSDARLTEVMATVMATDCVGLPSSSGGAHRLVADL